VARCGVPLSDTVAMQIEIAHALPAIVMVLCQHAGTPLDGDRFT
jgi:hypothetical protein